jgi:hypothetical protein
MDALATTALTHHAQSVPLLQYVRDPADCVDDAILCIETRGEVL